MGERPVILSAGNDMVVRISDVETGELIHTVSELVSE